jgi:hypothetical protein
MEVICSSETSVDFQRTTQRNILEGTILHNHLCDNSQILLTLSPWLR